MLGWDPTGYVVMVDWFFAPPAHGGVGPTGVCGNSWLVPLFRLVMVEMWTEEGGTHRGLCL